jgi:serine protease
MAQEDEHIPGDILVMLQPGASADRIVQDLNVIDGLPTGLRVVRELSAPMRAWLLHYDNAGISQPMMLRWVGNHPAVMMAQNNHPVHERAIPDDTQYGQQWQHQNIDSEAAWDITTGGLTATGDTIVVAIMENADLPHPDLAANTWHNFGEIPGNNVDDDSNGYVDDFQGWYASNGDDNVYGGPHGTEVAGMIGAVGNNGSQVAGANWHVKMMPVRYGNLTDADVMELYTYPLVMRRLYNSTDGALGAFVVSTNASWGIDNADHTQYPLWCAMYDTLGTAGILNCGATANNNVDIDEVDDMPTGCESDFMVSVTATDEQDMRTFSGYGATTIDVGAPGDQIFTTQIGGGTGSVSGTSFASPLTAGIIALLYSAPCASMMDLVNADPQEGALYVRQALFNGVEQVGNLPGNCVTGGRVNSNNSLEWIMANCGSCPAPYNLTATNDGLGTATFYWSSTASTIFNVRYRPEGSVDWITVTDVGTTSVSIPDVLLCTSYEFQVEGICDGETSGFGASYVFTSEGCCTAPGGIIAVAVDSSTANVEWTNVLVAINYDLRYSIEGANDWTELTGLTGITQALTELTGCNTYEVQMRTICDGTAPTDWSTSVLVSVPGCGVCTDLAFCPSSSDDASSEWIDRVRINTIDNTSGSNDGYAAFPEQGTTLEVGTPYTVFLTPGFNGGPFGENFSVWIDLDLDGQFQGLSERVFVGTESQTEVTGDLVVPVGSPLISSRMRVIMKFDQPVSSGCEDGYGFGETEDYCVTIVGASGLDENASANGARFFPNPADNTITIDVPLTLGKPALLEVLDNAGKAVIHQNVSQQRPRLNITALANGLYFFRVSNGQGTIARGKFEVSHD